MHNKKPHSSWRRIPFTEKEYWVTSSGHVISNARGYYSKLKQETMSTTQPLLDARILELGKRRGLQYNRLVFFCFKYPTMVGKKLERMTFRDFQHMPDIVHRNGKILDNRPINLMSMPSRSELNMWVAKKFPHKCVAPAIGKTSTVTGADLKQAKVWLLEGKEYAWIAQNLSTKVHHQAIYRLNKKLRLPSRIKGVRLSDAKRRRVQRLAKKQTQASLAKLFNVTESTISRLVRKAIL